MDRQKKEGEVSLAVLGSGAVGKSALTIKFVTGGFVEEYDPTIEDCYRKQMRLGDSDEDVCLLDILDTAGQDEYSAMRDQYMREGESFLVVYSCTSRDSFEETANFLELIYRNQDKDVDGSIPIVVCANKCDLAGELEVPHSEGLALSKLYGASFLTTSAYTGENVEDAFKLAAKLSLEAREELGADSSKKRRKRKAQCTIL